MPASSEEGPALDLAHANTCVRQDCPWWTALAGLAWADHSPHASVQPPSNYTPVPSREWLGVQLRQEACYAHVVNSLSSLYGVASSNSDSVASLPAADRQAARRQLLHVRPPCCAPVAILPGV